MLSSLSRFFRGILAYREDSFVRDSFIFFSASMILNLAGFLYHFFMGRLLGPESYGVLGVMLTLYYLIAVGNNVVQTAISRFIATYVAKRSEGMIDALYRRATRKLFFWGVWIFILFLLAGFFLVEFLRISFLSYIILGGTILFVFLVAICRGVLQGAQRFKGLGCNYILEGVSKLGGGLLFVFLGWGVYGAIAGLPLSLFVAYLHGAFLLRKLPRAEAHDIRNLDRSSIYQYSIPVILAYGLLTAVYSVDLLLVKHYMPAYDAGLYAAAALLGKIAFFASLSIIIVMFPKAADLQERQRSSIGVLKKSAFIVSIICGGVLAAYLLFPSLITRILYGTSFLSIAPSLWIFGIGYWLFSFAYLMGLYQLSLKRTKFLFFVGFIILLEVIAITFFHRSISQIAWIFVGINLLLAFGLALYSFFWTHD